MNWRRNLADHTCRALLALSPPDLREWVWAIRCETVEIRNDGEALSFALASVASLAPRVMAFHLSRPFLAIIGAVTLGMTYMFMAGAPARTIASNLGALVVGLAMMALVGRSKVRDVRNSGWLVLLMAVALAATALWGNEVNGVSCWIRLGGVALQPSLVLLPTMILLFARSPGSPAMTGMLLAAVALAGMPDRAMAGMLVAGLASHIVIRPGRAVFIALGGSVAAFTTTMMQADRSPSAPFVDRVLFASRDVHLLAGIAVLGGAVFMLAPALTGWQGDRRHDMLRAVFGVIWLTCLLAAACGNFPTPVVGYGGSAILGYALSLATVSRSAWGHGEAQRWTSDGVEDRADYPGQRLLLTLPTIS